MRADFVLVVQAGGSTRRCAYEGCTSDVGSRTAVCRTGGMGYSWSCSYIENDLLFFMDS